MANQTRRQAARRKRAERKRKHDLKEHQTPATTVIEAAPLAQVLSKEEQHKEAAHPEAQQKQKNRKNERGGDRHMNLIVPFLFESIFQIVTWVFIAAAIGGIYYFLSKGDWRGVLWSFCALICSVVIMICIIAQRHFSIFAVKAEPLQRRHPPLPLYLPRLLLDTWSFTFVLSVIWVAFIGLNTARRKL